MNTFHSISVLFFFFLLCLYPQNSDAQRYILFSGGNPCGMLELRTEKLRNGYTNFTIRESRSIITPEGKKQDYIRVSNCLVDVSLYPISVESTLHRGETKQTTKGSVVDGTMYLTTDFGKGRIERWREDVANAVVDISLPALAVRSLPKAPKRIYRLLDHRSINADLNIEADTANATVIISQAGNEFWHVSPEGTLLLYRHPDLGLAWEAEDETRLRPEPCILNAGVEWDAGIAVLPTAAENIKNMKVSIALKALTAVTLSPEDIRQKLETRTDDGSGTIRVATSRKFTAPASLPLPVLKKELYPFMRGDSLLSLDGDAVRLRAYALKAWEKESDVVLRALGITIRREFFRDQFIPVVTANGLAKSPRGSSLHISQLFIAVSRAVGLPARFVFGAVPQNGRWRTKVWVEVWSGEWRPIDPFVGEDIIDASYVKLLHAESVTDILNQSARLHDHVAFRVEEVQAADTSVSALLQTAIVGSTYTNKTYRCSITAPKPEWYMEEQSGGDETSLLLKPAIGSPMEFSVVLFQSTWYQSAEELLGARIKALQVLLDGLTLQQHGEVRLAGRRAPTITYTYIKKINGVNLRTTAAHCLIVDRRRCYMFSFSAPEEEFETIRPDMERVLREFRLY